MKQTSHKINKYTDGFGEIWNQICLIFLKFYLVLKPFRAINSGLLERNTGGKWHFPHTRDNVDKDKTDTLSPANELQPHLGRNTGT